MAAARPYLAITDQESEPARFAKEYGCGLWAPPQDTVAISEKLRWALSHQEELRKMGERGRAIVEIKFDKKVVMAEWFALCEDILKWNASSNEL
jgi:glycosyltransferase involved in cell wall biosynthesis